MMMRFIAFSLLVAFVGAKTRECPQGYTYVGDDDMGFSRSSYRDDTVKVGPVYSCYKILSVEQGGVNQATSICSSEKGKVVSFENHGEIDRFINGIDSMGFMWLAENNITSTMTFLTSGLKFTDVDRWMYLGTNYSLPNQTTIDSLTGNRAAEQCLGVQVSRTNLDTASHSFQFGYKYFSVPCTNFKVAACEVRVQMVTTYEWIFTNWIILGLSFIFMAFVVFSLCYCVCNACCCPNPGLGHDNRPCAAEKAPYPTDDLPTYQEAVEVPGPERLTIMQKITRRGKSALTKLYIWG